MEVPKKFTNKDNNKLFNNLTSLISMKICIGPMLCCYYTFICIVSHLQTFIGTSITIKFMNCFVHLLATSYHKNVLF